MFDALEGALPAGWQVFYSRPWLGLTRTGGERDGECDFVLVHPDRGVLTIEVKGGGIAFDPRSDLWTSEDANRRIHDIKNPVAQAMRAKHAILAKAGEQRNWPRQFVRFRHGVVFPDVASPPGDLGADRPRELFCCRPDLTRLRAWVEERLSGGNDEHGPGLSGLQALQNVLAKPFMLRTPLAYRLEDDDAAIAALTPEQYYILDSIAEVTRAAVGGGAGTGKTIVACEDARRLTEAGKRTLLTCRSLPLAADLRQRMQDSAVTVLSFDELVRKFVPSDRSGADPAELLMQAVEADPGLRFKAIIVDEAQDFKNHWWIALEELLLPDPEACLHAYFDTNQQLYGVLSAQIQGLSMVPIRLTRNLRNTKSIHAAATHHYKGHTIIADGPPGVSIALHRVADKEVAVKITAQVQLLTGVESVSSSDIVVLAPDVRTRDMLRKKIPSAVLCSTITDYKGLERAVVIVAATRAIADVSELAYVALSRARTHLIIVGESVVLDWLLPASAAAADRGTG